MGLPSLNIPSLDWHTVAYRGAQLLDIAKILSKASIPDHISTIIIAAGLNDRLNLTDTPFHNALILLNSIKTLNVVVIHQLIKRYRSDQRTHHVISSLHFTLS